MFFYYILLLLLPFYDYVYLPRIGQFTLIKMIGVAVVVAGAIKLLGVYDRVLMFKWAESRLFFLLMMVALVSVSFFSQQVARSTGILASQQSVLTSIFSLAAYLFATLVFVDSYERFRSVCYVTLYGMAFGALTVYNEYFRWHNSRPGGVATDPNYFAMEALSVLPMAITLGLGATGRFRKFLLLGIGLLIFGATLLTGSRGGLLGLGIGFLYFTFRTRRLKFLIVALGLTAIGMVLLPQSPLNRFLHPQTAEDKSVDVRIAVFKAGLKMIQDHPFTGVGLALYKPMTVVYGVGDDGKIAHNTYVEIAAEMGIPALVIFMSILWCSWRRSRRLTKLFRKNGNQLGEQIAVALETGLIMAMAAAVFLSAEWIRHLWLMVFLSLALQRIVYIEEMNRRTKRPATTSTPAWVASSNAMPVAKIGRQIGNVPSLAQRHSL